MADKSKIEWTEASWNPVVGCSRVSAGCDHCYAIRQAHRVQAMHGETSAYAGTTRETKRGLDWTGVVKLVPERLDQPLRWKRPRRIFVNSMSDLFHPSLSDDAIYAVLLAMYTAPWHTFQVLTKRPDRMARMLSRPPRPLGFELAQAALRAGWKDFPATAITTWPPPNAWFGTSVEDQATADARIPHLLDTPAAVRWLSMEPLLGPASLNEVWVRMPSGGQSLWNVLSQVEPRIHWVVVGGESGPGARPMHPAWVRSIRDQCQAASVPFFFKQWGGYAPVRSFVEHHAAASQGRTPRATSYHVFGTDGLDCSRDAGIRAAITGREGTCTVARVGKKAAGRLLDGRTWDEYPEVA